MTTVQHPIIDTDCVTCNRLVRLNSDQEVICCGLVYQLRVSIQTIPVPDWAKERVKFDEMFNKAWAERQSVELLRCRCCNRLVEKTGTDMCITCTKCRCNPPYLCLGMGRQTEHNP